MPTPSIGLNSYVRTGKEATYGGPVTRDHSVPIRSESIALSEPPLESESIQEIGVRGDRNVQGPVDIGGDLVIEGQYVGIGRFIEYALGNVSSAQPDPTNASTAYKHTYTVVDELPTSLTIEVFRGNQQATFDADDRNKAFLYDGCQISQINFSQSVDALLILTVSIIARQVTEVTKTTFSPSTSGLFRFSQATLTWGGTQLDVSDVSITVNNNLDDARRFIGSRHRSRAVRNSWLEVTGTFSTEFQNLDQYNDFRNATQRELIITWAGPVIGGSTTNELKITCSVGQIIEGAQPVVGAGGRVTVDLGFRAYRDATNKEIVIEITNESASSD